jgi:hypothetical protein
MLSNPIAFMNTAGYQQARGSPLQGIVAFREKAQWTRSIWLRK